jgi:hypothetical protein
LNTQAPGAFEFCETVNDHWAYVPGDRRFKSPVYLQQYFLETVGHGGNFLLNVGPQPDGSIDEGSARALRGLGQFVTHHRRALFGARAEGHPRVNPFGVTMKKDDHAYFFLTEQTRLLDELAVGGDPLAASAGEVPVTFTGVKSPVEAVQTFDGMALAFEQAGVNLRVTLPRQALAWPCTVLDVKTRGAAEVDGIVRPEQDGSYRLTPEWAAIYTPKPGAPGYRPASKGGGAIANWTQAEAIAEWLITVPGAGRFDVAIEQACSPDFAGSMYVVEIKRPCENVDRCGTLHLNGLPADARAAQANKGIARVPGVVQGTASWSDFRRVALGTVELPEGLVSVAVRPRTLAAGRLMDLRGMELTKEDHP